MAYKTVFGQYIIRNRGFRLKVCICFGEDMYFIVYRNGFQHVGCGSVGKGGPDLFQRHPKFR